MTVPNIEADNNFISGKISKGCNYSYATPRDQLADIDESSIKESDASYFE